MKIFSTLLVIILMILLLGCRGADKQKARDMIITRTMGLAYIEENKLPEAENAFKQLIKIAPHEALGYANLGLVYIRMGNYQEAEVRLKEALSIEPNDPEIQLNLAEVYILTNRKREAIQLLEKSLNHHPDHIRTMYKLGQNYSRSDTMAIRLKAEGLLKGVVEFLPANITARLELVDILLGNDKPKDALGYFEDLKQQIPEFPNEANQFYDHSISYMQQEMTNEAQSSFNIFRNIIKPTPLFRAGFDELTGMSGPLIGTPVVTFRKDIGLTSQSDRLAIETLRFTNVTSDAGLDIIPTLNTNSNQSENIAYTLAVADVDGNGTQDLYVTGWDGKNVRFLLLNNFGKYQDITGTSGIDHPGRDRQAIFTDYDNDGFLDLYLVNDQKNLLYYHYEPKKFRNTAASAGVAGTGSGIAAALADFDHDGDLDIYQANKGKNQFFRNNLDGTFTENSKKMGITGDEIPSGETVFADFDDDGDLDFLVLNKDEENYLYTNLRQGQFANITSQSGLSNPEGSKAVTLGDYNNDGRVDFCILPLANKSIRLFKNEDGKKFKKDQGSVQMESILDSVNCLDAKFLDFDNDGYLDLVVAGEPDAKNQNKNGVYLFHNDGTGIFEDASHVLPDDIPSIARIFSADYNEDGDLDLFLSGKDGKIYLLRNDGGNSNHYLKVQLVGLRSGSGKNNYFGIGAKVEVKSGDLYQSVFVSEPVSHFGLGARTKADIVRVLWTNGVPQNLFEPGSDQALLEKQILKGSCPFLYAWNGERYEFVTDVLWRSALGMPLGIMGGETAYAFADPSEDYFKIPGERLREKDGHYSLQLTAELWETAYFDQVQLMVIDHPDSVDIYVDERFTPPPFPPLEIHQVGHRQLPKSVKDDQGNELIDLIREKDNNYISNLISDRYQGITKPHDLIIDLGNLSREDKITLYLNGWLFPTDASINLAISQSSQTTVFPPLVQVKNRRGQWQTVIENISFPMGKNKYIILDLSDKFLSNDYRVRISTTMQIYWDYIFFTTGELDSPVNVQRLDPASADLHYRGFSRMYRKGGKHGPFWFDYNDVSTEPIWRDLVGYYTRYGDVRELLIEADSKYIVANAGDEMSLEFDTAGVSELRSGWKRDFIIYTNGWLKDGDLNTAAGQTVEPLPFRGMSQYPYGSNESYPKDKEHQQYLKKYNTRKITTDRLHSLLK
jgi:tetratricopeptide (TPR) repeat protein